MIRLAQNSRESQEHRLKIKTLNQRMQNVAVHGTGLSPWEAKVLVEAIEQVYFADPALRQVSDGQLKYSCVAINEPAVKTFVQLYKQYQHKPFFKQRIGEIEFVGSQYYMAQDEKKDSISPSGTYKGGMSR